MSDPHDELIRALTTERFGKPTSPPSRLPHISLELLELMRELNDEEHEGEVA